MRQKAQALVGTARKIFREMQLGTRVEVNRALFISLSHYKAFALMQIDVLPVESYKLANAHAGRREKINDGKVPLGFACISQDLQLLVT